MPTSVDRSAFPVGTRFEPESEAAGQDYCEATLAQDAVVAGFPCSAVGPVAIGGGALLGLTLAEDHRVRELVFEAGTHLALDRNGAVAVGTLAGDQIVGGRLCLGGTRVVWQNDGHLREATPAATWELEGVPCRAGAAVTFDSGALAACELASDHVIDGVPCLGGARITRYRGRLSRATLATDIRLAGILFAAGHDVWGALHEGRARGGVLRGAQTVGGRRCRAGTRVALDGGTVRRFTPDEDLLLGRIPCLAGAEVELFDDGRVERATLSGPWTFAGVQLGRGDRLTGEIDQPRAWTAALSEARRGRDGAVYPAGAVLWLRTGLLGAQVRVRPDDHQS